MRSNLLAEKVGLEPTRAFQAPNALAVRPLDQLEYFSVFVARLCRGRDGDQGTVFFNYQLSLP